MNKKTGPKTRPVFCLGSRSFVIQQCVRKEKWICLHTEDEKTDTRKAKRLIKSRKIDDRDILVFQP